MIGFVQVHKNNHNLLRNKYFTFIVLKFQLIMVIVASKRRNWLFWCYSNVNGVKYECFCAEYHISQNESQFAPNIVIPHSKHDMGY